MTISAKYSRQLEVLGNTERLKILEVLTARPMCVQDINKNLFASQATVSYHLSLLKECGFIKADRSGKFMVYSLCRAGIKAHLKELARDFSSMLAGSKV